MSSLGTFLILASFVVASGAFAASLAGARRRSTPLVRGGLGLFHVVTALMGVASALMIYAFVIGDYRIKYVQTHSNAEQPLFYKLASYWGGLDGSIMFWVTLLAIFGSVAVYVNRERHRVLVPWVVSVVAVVEMFFLFLMVVHNNPFEPYLLETPTAGRGLSPLLQNFYMAIHPPMLYLGFVGMTIPFAFGIAALASGQLDDAWLRAVRRWTMTSWVFLSVGLALGAEWAYNELGWGGYWGWDPVENAGLLPWFTGTAFLHSVMVQERRGMLKIWNVSLVILTFFLTIFGTFMTRSGIVQSVHAFGEDRELAWMFTVFMVITLAVSFALVIYRLPMLRARNELDSWASKEAAFLANNWILLFSAFFILFATMFPTLSEALRGERLTMGPSFYNKWMVPIGFTLLFLTGVGPLLAWRKSTLTNLREQFLWPVSAGVAIGAAVIALGIDFWPSGLCFGLCGFVGTTMLQEFARGASVRRRATGTDYFTALVGLFARSRRRYAGYIVHVGMVLIFIGFAGGGYEQEDQQRLTPGKQMSAGRYVVTMHALTVSRDFQKQMVTAEVEAFRDGKSLGRFYPAKWYFNGREDEPTTEVALRRSLADDLYLVLGDFDAGQQLAALHVKVNPLVNWIWFGVGVLVIGTIIALLSERALAFAASRVPEGAATTSLLLLLLLGGSVTPAHAQHVVQPQARVEVPKTQVEKQLQSEIICMCGTCGRKRIGECTCSLAAEMRGEVARLIEGGADRERVIQYFVTKYGSQEVLSAPIDRGFNRLAWLLPYGVGAAAIMAIGGMVIGWTRRRDVGAVAPVAAAPVSRELEQRLDDELRDLD